MWLVDSALRDKVGSLWLAASIDTRVLSPCSPLHNPTFSSQILESCGVGGFGLQSSLESCAKLSPNLRKILESSVVRVARKLTLSVIASGFIRVAIHTKKADSSYQRCVGKGGSKGLVWSFMDSRLWDKLCRICCCFSKSFFKDSKDFKVSFADCSSSGLVNLNTKGFLPAAIKIALTNAKAPAPAKKPIKKHKYIMTPLQKMGDYNKKRR